MKHSNEPFSMRDLRDRDLSCPYCKCRVIKMCEHKKNYYECLNCYKIYNKKDVLRRRMMDER